MRRWEHGEVIVLQEVWRGKLWTVRPVWVAVDRPDIIALWCPAGTPVKGPSAPWRPGRNAGPTYFVSVFTERDWEFADFVWPTNNLMLLRPGDWYSVWVSWTETLEPMGWYVNFQLPFTRTAHAVQTMDLMLDLIVHQDRTWHWKDEDEFEALLDRDLITEFEAASVHRAAESVLRDITRGLGIYGERWHEWRPHSTWEIPGVPSRWTNI
jgi:Protein of unknown function (DUF402)